MRGRSAASSGRSTGPNAITRAIKPLPTRYSSVLALRDASGLYRMHLAEPLVHPLANGRHVRALEHLGHEHPARRQQPLGPGQRLLPPAPAERAWSADRMPVVSGAMSDSTASNARRSPSSSSSVMVKTSPTSARAPGISAGSGVAVQADHRAVPPHHPGRVFQPRAGPAAEVQHPLARPQQPELLVDLLQLEHRARGIAALARLLEEGVVPLALVAQRSHCYSSSSLCVRCRRPPSAPARSAAGGALSRQRVRAIEQQPHLAAEAPLRPPRSPRPRSAPSGTRSARPRRCSRRCAPASSPSAPAPG